MGNSKKFIAALLLGISIVPIVLLFALQLSKTMNRHAVKEQLEHSRLQKIVLPKNQIHWAKAGKEIIVAGEMFDVHHLQTLPNGNIEFYGLSDKKEDQLNKEVDLLLNKKKGLETNIIKTALWVMVDSVPKQFSLPLIPFILPAQHSAYCCVYFSAIPEILAPPPKLLSHI